VARLFVHTKHTSSKSIVCYEETVCRVVTVRSAKQAQKIFEPIAAVPAPLDSLRVAMLILSHSSRRGKG